MFSLIIVLVVIASILMCAIVFIQESKGGGLASGFSSGNSMLGVRKTTDVVEKTTWGLAIAMVVLSVLSVFFLSGNNAESDGSVLNAAQQTQQATGNTNPVNSTPAPAQQEAPAQQAPAQQ